jgi:tRNA-Thr(GGU) m(6)t(6)A37 methyltransferase TsaA
MFHYPPIGFIRQSPFREKFGVPRQSMMVMAAQAMIKLEPVYGYKEALLHLEMFSHLWILFEFDRSVSKEGHSQWQSLIIPPRIEAPAKVGLFASRSPHRPNPIGMSVVKLDRVDRSPVDGAEIWVSGIDCLEGTPVLDIKPYLPYADCVMEANSGWIEEDIKKVPVSYAEECNKILLQHQDDHPRLRELVIQLLEWDPRPRSQREQMPLSDPQTVSKIFAFRVLEFDIHYEVVVVSGIVGFKVIKIDKLF